MKKLFLSIAVIVALVSLSSCATQIGTLSVISSKTTAIQIGQKGNQVTGKGSTIDDAIKDALSKAGGDYDALIDTKVSSIDHYIIIYAWTTYKVVGTPVKL